MKGRPSKRTPFSVEIEPDYRGLLACLRRGGTPQRVHFYELYLDAEIQDLLCDRYGLVESLDPGDPCFSLEKEIALQRFLGYDTVLCPLDGFDLPLRRKVADDTSAVKREGGREFIDEHRGPISSWEEFEAYPWPDPRKASTRSLEWYTENLPDNMCIVARGVIDRFLEFDRVEIVLAADDMGFRSGTLISPDGLRALVLPGHTVRVPARGRILPRYGEQRG